MEKQQISKQKLITLMGACLVVGTCSTISFKYQNRSYVNGQKFDHQFIQTWLMFVGEILCFPIFMYYVYFRPEQYKEDLVKAESQGLKTKINPFLLLIPTTCDCITSTLQHFGLFFLPASVYSMMRGGNIIITCAFSVFFLKRKIYKHHYFGIGLLVLGLFTVGLSEVLSQSGDQTENFTLGIIFILISFFFYSTQLTLEEKYFGIYALNPFQVVGIEGIFGIILISVIIAIVSQIPCSDQFNDSGHLEDVQLFFQQIFDFSAKPAQPLLFISILTCICAILVLNALYLTITKYSGSLTRQLISLTSPLLVWFLTLCFGWEKFQWGELIGFIVLAIGNCVYNEIMIIPWFGLNLHTKAEVKKQEEARFLLLQSEETVPNESQF